MTAVRACELPPDALLRKYLHDGSYADCFSTDVARPVTHADYVEAFYTTRLFKLERSILARLVGRPSTDAQARSLARGAADDFAAWRVEDRAADQLLLCDFRGRTRSWLMCAAVPPGDAPGTRLYFGSGVVPVRDKRTGQARMGLAFGALLGFHKLYSRALLRAASRRLARQHG